MTNNSELKSIEYIEKMIRTNSLEKMSKSIKVIEEEFSKFAYLKSLIDMKKQGQL